MCVSLELCEVAIADDHVADNVIAHAVDVDFCDRLAIGCFGLAQVIFERRDCRRPVGADGCRVASKEVNDSSDHCLAWLVLCSDCKNVVNAVDASLDVFDKFVFAHLAVGLSVLSLKCCASVVGASCFADQLFDFAFGFDCFDDFHILYFGVCCVCLAATHTT